MPPDPYAFQTRRIRVADCVLAGERRVADEGVHERCSVDVAVLQRVRTLGVEDLRVLEHPVEDREARADGGLQLAELVARGFVAVEPALDQGQAAGPLSLAGFVRLLREEGADDDVAGEARSGAGVFGVFDQGLLEALRFGAAVGREVEDLLADGDGFVQGLAKDVVRELELLLGLPVEAADLVEAQADQGVAVAQGVVEEGEGEVLRQRDEPA